ncbi:thioredoxin fold domain-containing protein [Thiomicrorhabdus sp.]|uniref:thioredoxin family protein n=1 Tax=Thiomicrorhabdus sp. TaxID=2039724 RepID=UPI0029C78D8E|nr:thioredoxin fold domain-containing protein [Thiomicrorhabdus sp.]
MIKRIFLAFFLASLSLSAVAADSFFDETFGNYQEDLETAKEDGKKGIFMFFFMDECPFCHRMRSTIMTEPDVVKLYRDNFLTFTHDIEGSNEVVNFDGQAMTAQDLAEKVYRVRATPVMIIFGLDGKPIVRYTGPTRTKEEFKWLAEYVVDGSYKKESFTVYKRAKKRESRQ